MKQLMHVKVGGSSYFIESDSVIYAGNDGVKYVCGNQLQQIYGYPEGLGSFTEPNFLKIGGKHINKDRIIAYTNTGVAVNTGTQYFETINYSNASEFNNLQKYFDPTDSTDIDGWNIVKDKVCSFQPGSSNINGQIAEDIRPVAPTPPGPTPTGVVVRMTELVDDSWNRVTTITKQNSTYRMFMTVEGADDPVGYVRDNLIFAWGGIDMETPGFAVSDHHTATEDVMVEFWTSTLRDEYMNNGKLEVYMVEQRYPDTLVAEIPATIEATPVVPVNITSVNMSPNVVTEDGTYNLTIMTDNYTTQIPADVIRQHLSVSINGKGTVEVGEIGGSMSFYYTTLTVSGLRPDYGGNLTVYISSIGGGGDYSGEFPIQEPQPEPEFAITSAYWVDMWGAFELRVDTSGSFRSELIERLSTDCTDMDSSPYAQIENIEQVQETEYHVFLNNKKQINGTVHLYDNNVQIAEHNFS